MLSEANRSWLPYLFDPLLAVHTTLVERLPDQIAVVYMVNYSLADAEAEAYTQVPDRLQIERHRTL